MPSPPAALQEGRRRRRRMRKAGEKEGKNRPYHVKQSSTLAQNCTCIPLGTAYIYWNEHEVKMKRMSASGREPRPPSISYPSIS
jgi:hypothetical protein